ncbi:serine/threonine-protein kinase STY13-like [Silene latifolia]|uniref:serine/threonine-protein kinase STY13-like n=1 Tax=Silene latifolia TaxID=37657 RepID=UPI003D77D073
MIEATNVQRFPISIPKNVVDSDFEPFFSFMAGFRQLDFTANLLLTADHKSVKLAVFGFAREETLTEMTTAETGTYRWISPKLFSISSSHQGEKRHYNNKVHTVLSLFLWTPLGRRM